MSDPDAPTMPIRLPVLPDDDFATRVRDGSSGADRRLLGLFREDPAGA